VSHAAGCFRADGDWFCAPNCTHDADEARADERSRYRAAIIGLLWNVFAADEDESCDGDCQDDDPKPFPACAAMRALDWGQHYTKDAFLTASSKESA